ncbi:MFS transporter [Georgenia thermotolerans]|uniref:DHA2 family efflux MFS transporter permease subunit n=1 Tax=Georgenia thermotolerans TaxID=527326 RepID=A0A7J5UPU2_9MICO|nr:MFS transporter [Georgenia thermotolerans]KAE8764134.1 DHA2 family efflux MFS transporter permease subunit [Georgenia thermotolerans]
MPDVALRSAQGRWVVLAATLGSAMALLDGTVVNVALRPLGEDLGASLADLQWVVNAYMLTLASLILVGGSLGDRLGRRRVFLVGVVWFAAASLACGLAQSSGELIVARGVQGVGGALLTPGSLAMIQGTIAVHDRARAIGVWSAWSGVAAALGPLLGGWIVDTISWRWVFLINVPVAAAVVAVGLRHVPESGGQPRAARAPFDVAGAALAVVALGGVTFALIQGGWVPAAVGGVGLAAFLAVEHRGRNPMLALGVFADRTFAVVNLMTFVVYGALAAVMFFLVLQLQVVGGFTPLQAGLATLPFTVLMLVFSPRVGALMARTGPRPLLAAGPALAAAGAAMLTGVSGGVSYVSDALPGVVVFGAGITLMVTPLTATVLAALPDAQAGIASGVNNAVARAGSLIAVAALPAVVGLSGADYGDPAVFDAGYRAAMWWCAGLLLAGALVAGALLPSRRDAAGGTGAGPPRTPPRPGGRGT